MSLAESLLLIIAALLVLGSFAGAHKLDRIIIILERIRKGDPDQF